MEISNNKALKNTIFLFLLGVSITILGFNLNYLLIIVGLIISVFASILVFYVVKRIYLKNLQIKFDEKNIRNGIAKVYYEDSLKVKSTITMVDGVRHGEYKVFYKDGTICIQANYINGKYHGTLVEYYSNGSTAFITDFDNGIQKGNTNFFHENGKIYREFVLDNNNQYHGLKEYDISGKLKFQWIQNRLTFYNKKGDKSSEIAIEINADYKFDTFDSDWASFLNHCTPTGPWYDYREDGSIESEFIFTSGFEQTKNGFFNVYAKFNVGTKSEYSVNTIGELVKGFHINFISEQATSRRTNYFCEFKPLIRIRDSSIRQGYKVKYREIIKINDILKIHFN
jgi:hypothetical protein